MIAEQAGDEAGLASGTVANDNDFEQVVVAGVYQKRRGGARLAARSMAQASQAEAADLKLTHDTSASSEPSIAAPT